jgi:hypothetical protein
MPRPWRTAAFVPVLYCLSSIASAESRFSAPGLVWTAAAGGGPVVVDTSGRVHLVENAGYSPVCGATLTEPLYLTTLDTSGREVLRRVFIGCGHAAGLAIGPQGDAYVVGDTSTSVFTPTASFTAEGAFRAAFVVRVDSAGRVRYATLVGGMTARASAIAIDGSGNAWVAGAGDDGLWTTPDAFDRTFNGGGAWATPLDGIIFELDSSGSLLYSSYYGGSDDDEIAGIALDSSGNLIVAGTTASANLPVTSDAFQASKDIWQSGFVARFTPTGSVLRWGTFLGGRGFDRITGMALHADDVYVAGFTSSSDFPTTVDATQPAKDGYSIAGFAARLTKAGTLAFGTYLYGSGNTGATLLSIVSGSDGDAFVVGESESPDYPVTSGALQTAPQGQSDVVMTRLTASGQLRYSTRLGGGASDRARGIALGPDGDVYVTAESSPAFPLSPDTVRTIAIGSNTDRYVARLIPRAARGRSASATSEESASLTAGNAIDGDPATRWSSAFSDPQALVIDLGESIDVDRVVLVWERAAARSYDLSISNDLESWRTIGDASDSIGGVADFNQLTGTGRYLAVTASSRATEWGDSLWEAIVLGEPTYAGNWPPTVTLTSPLEGERVLGGAPVRIAADASDPETQPVSVSFFVDGIRVGTDREVPFELQTVLPIGPHQIAAEAVDPWNAVSARVAVSIVVMPAVDGVGDIAHGRPVTASSTEGPGLEARYAVDGSTSTRWASQFSDPQWIAVDLGARFDIQTVVLVWEAAYAIAFDIQVSNDGTAWTTIRSMNNGAGGTQVLSALAGNGRFVRMLGRQRGTPWGYSLWDLQVFGVPSTAGPDNLAKGRPTTASSIENGAFAGRLGTDGDATTRWSSAFAEGQWLSVDLGEVYDLSRVVVRWEVAYASRYFIDVSFDGENWRTVADRRGLPESADETLLSGASGRYVRVVGAERGTIWGISLWELEVYGAPAPQGPDIALNAAVSASGLESAQYEPRFAVDGNLSTRWSSRFADGEWLTLDLGALFKLSEIRLTWEAAYATAYRVDVSPRWSDSWHTVFSTSSGNGGTDDLSVSAEARYITVVCEQRATPWGCSLFEVSVFGAAAEHVNPGWRILALIYDRTDFSYTEPSGRMRHVAGVIDEYQLAAAKEATDAFVQTDIPRLTSGQMVPQITIRNAGTLTRLSFLGSGWWPSPWDVARDPAFDAVIVVWQPNVVDQTTGEFLWIGTAAGLALDMGTGQTYFTIIADAATTYGHRNVFKHEFGHSLTWFFDAAGTAPKPRVENHTDGTQYVHCGTGGSYIWMDETLSAPVPNSIYNNDSGFTHDYYSGMTALVSDPLRCLGITNEAWAAGGPVSRP